MIFFTDIVLLVNWLVGENNTAGLLSARVLYKSYRCIVQVHEPSHFVQAGCTTLLAGGKWINQALQLRVPSLIFFPSSWDPSVQPMMLPVHGSLGFFATKTATPGWSCSSLTKPFCHPSVKLFVLGRFSLLLSSIFQIWGENCAGICNPSQMCWPI